MQIRIVLFAALSSAMSGLAFATPPTVETLLKACADKTIVVNRDAKRVGERLGGYCAGYLEATLDAMKNTQPVLCGGAEERSTEYLLSVFQTYLNDVKVDRSSQATKALMAAYRRTFTCGSAKK